MTIRTGMFPGRSGQIVFNQLDGNTNAIWSFLLASGYLKAISREPLRADRTGDVKYTPMLTNREVCLMFQKMVRDWFGKDDVSAYYNEFINALLQDDVRRMNTFKNKVALNTFSYFDTGKRPSGETHPEEDCQHALTGARRTSRGRRLFPTRFTGSCSA